MLYFINTYEFRLYYCSKYRNYFMHAKKRMQNHVLCNFQLILVPLKVSEDIGQVFPLYNFCTPSLGVGRRERCVSHS